ncbi:Co-chaperone HscB, C-terminal oligomerization domain-containing protein [Gongronella butleri]|nr:Co-chaperone HscB, C-terminal oligomerization domain-containing protein [Gongronella butleri]
MQRTLPLLTRVVRAARPLSVRLASPLRIAVVAVPKRSFVLTPARYHRANDASDDPVQKVCWKCHHPASRASVSCSNDDCGAIQPVVSDLSYFELLKAGTGSDKTQPTFNVNPKTLKIQFLRLQQQAHPDSFSNAPEREKKYAEIQSSMLNKAYHTLKDPLPRAQYMLAQHGVEVNESESLTNMELLMEVMEVHEEMEEATTHEDVEAINEENNQKIKNTCIELGKAFDAHDYDLAKDLTIQLQYWDNIRRGIIDWVPGSRVEIKH